MRSFNVEEIIMLVGVGRSGTTLVQAMMSAHPMICFPPETGFFRRYVSKGTIRNLMQSADQDGAAQILRKDRFLQRLPFDVATILRSGEIKSDLALYKQLLQQIAIQENKLRVGDKDPRAIELVGLLPYAFDSPKVIHVLRDPRDILVSRKNAKWSRDYSLLRHLFAMSVQLRIFCRTIQRYPHLQNYTVRYEALLEEPVTELARMCESVGVPYDAKMLNYSGAADRLVSPDESEWKQEVRGPLLRDNSGKWRQALRDSEIALVELVCREHFEIGNYTLTRKVKRMPIVRRTSLYIIAYALFVCGYIYEMYVRWKIWKVRKYI